MDYEEAKKLVGSQPSFALAKMVIALRMHPWLNTSEDKRRLKAALVVLRHRRRNRG